LTDIDFISFTDVKLLEQLETNGTEISENPTPTDHRKHCLTVGWALPTSLNSAPFNLRQLDFLQFLSDRTEAIEVNCFGYSGFLGNCTGCRGEQLFGEAGMWTFLRAHRSMLHDLNNPSRPNRQRYYFAEWVIYGL